jgi:hypothetical protein
MDLNSAVPSRPADCTCRCQSQVSSLVCPQVSSQVCPRRCPQVSSQVCSQVSLQVSSGVLRCPHRCVLGWGQVGFVLCLLSVALGSEPGPHTGQAPT